MLSIRFIRIIPLIFLILLLPGWMTGQQITGKRSIQWTPVQSMRIGNHDMDVFHFRYASYELNSLLPNYYEAIKIENNSEYKVRIENPVFQEVDYELIRDMRNLKDIPSQITVTSRRSSLKKEKHLQIGVNK